jgi:hypothetical protein
MTVNTRCGALLCLFIVVCVPRAVMTEAQSDTAAHSLNGRIWDTRGRALSQRPSWKATWRAHGLCCSAKFTITPSFTGCAMTSSLG